MKQISKSERILPFGLLMFAAIVIAIATLVEDSRGTQLAHRLIYGSFWFKLLWGAIVITGVHWIYKCKLWLKLPVFGLHASFVIILFGALTTSIFSQNGTIHMRKAYAESFFLSDKEIVCRLPFSLVLDSFCIKYYPGTQTPQDYISYVSCPENGKEYEISMNHIAEIEGYRFYQASYDPDMKGTTLSINHDPWGTRFTYFGYALLGLCMMLTILQNLTRKQSQAFILLSILFLSTLPAHASVPTLSKEKIDKMEHGQVIWNDRVAPMGTLSKEFLQKVYGGRSYNGLSPTEVVVSWTLSPEQWASEPIIKVKNKGLREQLGIEGKYACLQDFFDEKGEYRLISEKPSRAVQEIDEKVGLVLMLTNGTLIHPLQDGTGRLSETRINTELFYNQIDWTLIGMIACLVVALFCLGARKKTTSQLLLKIIVLTFLTTAFLLRWYISGHLPLSNGYETMLFAAMVLIAMTIAMPSLGAAGCGICFFLLLVAHLGQINPQITQLMPVLHSPWLSAHVSIIMISYAMLTLSFFDRRLLQYAVFLLSAGIFLGAIWANVSWGTYWSWDPKESWALITLLIYSIPLHTKSIPWLQNERNYRIYSILALASLVMTYFGVNYLLGGMHSYAG